MLRLVVEFMKIGLFAIGGGLATVPFLLRLGETMGYYTHDELLTMIAVSESTPGPIGINMATFAGIRAAGYTGGVVATLSLILPCVVITIIIAHFLKKFQGHPVLDRMMRYLKPAGIGCIAAAVYTLVLSLGASQQRWAIWIGLALALAIFLLRRAFPKAHPGIFLVGACILGMILDLTKGFLL